MGSEAAGHAGVTRGQLETKESDMKRYATLLIATLAVLGLANAAKADWGFLAYGGCQPWWNPFGMGKRHGQKVEERRLRVSGTIITMPNAATTAVSNTSIGSPITRTMASRSMAALMAVTPVAKPPFSSLR